MPNEKIERAMAEALETLRGYQVKRGKDGEWGIFSRSFNVRIATFSRGTSVDADHLRKALDVIASTEEATGVDARAAIASKGGNTDG